MKETAPVLFVDDDPDDHHLVTELWDELKLKNPILFFDNGEKMLFHLKSDSTVPLLIICDVNLPMVDGFEIKRRLLGSYLNYKSIPFVFWSNKASKTQIKKAYDLCANGFFIKPTQYGDMKESIRRIVEYWLTNEQPEDV